LKKKDDWRKGDGGDRQLKIVLFGFADFIRACIPYIYELATLEAL